MIYRTRFKNEIVAEFTPPSRRSARRRVIILCDGMPSMPRKQSLMQFLADKGFWVFYPRYRGAWESDGVFMRHSPHRDILDVVEGLGRKIRENAFGRTFSVNPHEIFVVGGSFGGTASLLCSLDTRVKKVIANCPVVDWSILRNEQKKETNNRSYPAYIREAFGRGYRLPAKNWNKLLGGTFFNPVHHLGEFGPSKIMMFHAKDDPYIPWRGVKTFAQQTGAKFILLSRGGHISTDFIVRKYWPRIAKFFEGRR